MEHMLFYVHAKDTIIRTHCFRFVIHLLNRAWMLASFILFSSFLLTVCPRPIHHCRPCPYLVCSHLPPTLIYRNPCYNCSRHRLAHPVHSAHVGLSSPNHGLAQVCPNISRDVPLFLRPMKHIYLYT